MRILIVDGLGNRIGLSNGLSGAIEYVIRSRTECTGQLLGFRENEDRKRQRGTSTYCFHPMSQRILHLHRMGLSRNLPQARTDSIP